MSATVAFEGHDHSSECAASRSLVVMLHTTLAVHVLHGISGISAIKTGITVKKKDVTETKMKFSVRSSTTFPTTCIPALADC